MLVADRQLSDSMCNKFSINNNNERAMREKVLDAFKALGFELEHDEACCYGFHYENLFFLYLYNENDEDFLTIACPCSIGNEDIDELAYYQLMDKVNSTMKYVKANTMNGNIWLFYERDLCNEANLKDMLTHIVMSLEAAYIFLHRELEALKGDADTENTDSEITDEADDDTVE